MLKKLEMSFRDSCLNKADDDEPIFVLRGKDKLAPSIVRQWVNMSEMLNVHEDYKLTEARMLADEMEAWRSANVEPK